jgi:predicted phosphodiesterase
MTRLAILADIHGNLPALEAVLADLATFPVDGVVVAGDLINWGPFSATVVERAISEGWAVIRGNNEFYLLDYDTPRAPAAWADPTQYTMLPWLRRQLAGPLHTRIAAWPDTLSICPPDAPPLRILHGSAHSNSEGIVPQVTTAELAVLLDGVQEETVVAAHTHLPFDRRIGRWHLLNPGSVGVPLQGELAASYLLLEGDHTGWCGTFQRVPIDNAALFAAFVETGFAAECGVVGELVIDEFRTARLQVLPFLLWRQATCPTAPFDAATLARFRAIAPPAYHDISL